MLVRYDKNELEIIHYRLMDVISVLFCKTKFVETK
jgi:hypothetical protein